MFTSLFTSALCLSSVLAQAPVYEFISIHSGDPSVHLAAVTYDSNSGRIGLRGDKPMKTVFVDTELQQVNATTQLFVNADADDGHLTLGPEGQEGFSITNNNLKFQNMDDFVVCPSQNYTIYFESGQAACGDSVGIALYASQINQ